MRQEDEYHVSYNLEEAARLFQLIKNTIDWSTIKLTSVSNVNDAQNSTLDVIHRDEVYARRLQAELNRGNANEPRRGTQVPSENQALPAQEVTTGLPVLGANQPIGRLKNCSHRCDLVSTRQCCTCSGKIDIAKDYISIGYFIDRRPNHQGARYEGYVDGQGMVYHARRNEHYCSTCKRR